MFMSEIAVGIDCQICKSVQLPSIPLHQEFLDPPLDTVVG